VPSETAKSNTIQVREQVYYKGFIGACHAGFISPQQVAGIFGKDYDENIAETAEANEIAAEHGVPSPFSQLIL